MSTRSTRRRNQQVKRLSSSLSRRAYTLVLADSGKNPPDFGPVKVGPDLADPTRTERVIKEVLPLGRHKAGYDDSGKAIYWNVDSAELAQILSDFKVQKAVGADPSLCKTHGDEDLQPHPDDLITSIDDMKLFDGSLWMSAYVTPEEKAYLANPAHKTSIAVIPNHEHAGKVYKRYTTHVAVVDRASVPGLSPFLALADSGGSMDFAALIELINKLIEIQGGSPLPDDTSEENIIERLNGYVSALGGKTTTEETPAPTPAEGTPMDSLEMTGVPPAMRDSLKKFSDGLLSRVTERDQKIEAQEKEIKKLTDELETRNKSAKTAAKAAFDAECEKVMKVPDARGYVATKADVDNVKALADSLGNHDLRLLSTINRPLKLNSAQARALADETPPKVTTTDSANVRDPEARKATAERIAAKRGISLADAMKFLPTVGG